MTNAIPSSEPVLASHLEVRSTSKSQLGLYLAIVGAAGVPLSLLWDYSWECTIGVDLFWSPPHLAIYASVLLGLAGALYDIGPRKAGVHLGFLSGPLGAWITLWGAAAFLVATVFDRWWQGAYGLSAGIWHPPQICKAIAFFALTLGAWVRTMENASAKAENVHRDWLSSIAPGSVLALLGVINITAALPNRQHSGFFYEISCAIYPVVLMAASVVGCERNRICRAITSHGAFSRATSFAATKAAIVYTLIWCLMLWGLPLFAARPQVAPVYNPVNHMMPMSFPLLLIGPAVVLDFILSSLPVGEFAVCAIAGLAFALTFGATQWFCSPFLLSDASANWIFAGGGRHWPFFFKIGDSARQVFWTSTADELNENSSLIAVLWAIASAWCGYWLGSWMRGLRR
jgi:hypothetical protein